MDFIWYWGFGHLLFDGAMATIALYYCAFQHLKRSYRPTSVKADSRRLGFADVSTEN